MTQITLNLPPELEAQLVAAATKQGVELSRYVADALQGLLQQQTAAANNLPRTEVDLLEQINLGISSEEWAEYHALIEKRQAETLTPSEHDRLIEISDRIEALNVQRMQALIKLAELRGDSLDTVTLESLSNVGYGTLMLEFDRLREDISTLPNEAQQLVADFVAFLKQRHQPMVSEVRQSLDLDDEPFVGMWRDRADRQDSVN